MVALSEPCNACSICLEISDGRSLDVMEGCGLERGLMRCANCVTRCGLPLVGRAKVYTSMKFTCHQGAFNALLKRWKTSARHFISTTELHKVPVTIRLAVRPFSLKSAKKI